MATLETKKWVSNLAPGSPVEVYDRDTGALVRRDTVKSLHPEYILLNNTTRAFDYTDGYVLPDSRAEWARRIALRPSELAQLSISFTDAAQLAALGQHPAGTTLVALTADELALLHAGRAMATAHTAAVDAILLARELRTPEQRERITAAQAAAGFADMALVKAALRAYRFVEEATNG